VFPGYQTKTYYSAKEAIFFKNMIRSEQIAHLREWWENEIFWKFS
jgi:hypothetical protein